MKTDDVNSRSSSGSHQSSRTRDNTARGSDSEALENGLRRDATHFLPQRPAASNRSESVSSADQVDEQRGNPGTHGEFAPAGELVQSQARELADYLQGRLQELDRREAEFHAQVAGWEQERRRWRSSVQQREKEFHEQQQRLETEQRQVCQQTAAMAVDQMAWEQDVAKLKQSHRDQQESLNHEQEQFALQQQQFEQSRLELANEQAEWALQYQAERQHWEQMCQELGDQKDRRKVTQELARQEKQLEELANTLDDRRQRIEELEARLQEDAAQFEKLQDDYNQEREELRSEQVECYQGWQQQQQRQQRELRLAWEELSHRQVETGHREDNLQRLQSDLKVLEQQVLEMYVALEQLCSKAEQETAGLQLPDWFSDIRERLRQYHHSIGDEVIEQEERFERAAQQLAERQRGLAQQHRRLSRWAQQEQQRIDARVEQMTGREQKLAFLQQQYQQQKTAWLGRLRRQQQRLRKLLAS